MSSVVKTIFILFVIFSITASFAESCPKLFSVDTYQTISAKIQNEKQLRLIFTHEGNIEKLRGTGGYIFISLQYFEGNMYRAYAQVLRILGKDRFKQLEWRLFRGVAWRYEELRKVLIDQKSKDGRLNPYYIGMEGMMIFASNYFYGDIHTAYLNAYALLEPAEFALLGWKDFLGNANEMYELRNKIIWRKNNVIRDQYIGEEGRILFANLHFSGDELFAFMRISAVLNSTEFSKLNWQEPSHNEQLQYRVTPSNKLVFHSSALVLEDYIEQIGYMRMADKFFDGDMKKTYDVIYNKFGFHKMQQMKWKKFNGYTWEFYTLRQQITDAEGKLLVKYIGDRGYFSFARDNYDGDMKSAFEDIISVLNKAEERLLQWSLFYGSIWDFARVRLTSADRSP